MMGRVLRSAIVKQCVSAHSNFIEMKQGLNASHLLNISQTFEAGFKGAKLP